MADDTKQRLSIIRQIFDLHASIISETESISEFNLACKAGCSACCTANVTMTWLEGELILDHIPADSQARLHKDLKKIETQKRFIPKTTSNHIAELCAADEEIPDEEIDPVWGVCPFLSDDLCSIYESRPMGCRCMVSSKDCSISGAAQTDPFILTVNNVFLQYIEHISATKPFGNLLDVMLNILNTTDETAGSSNLVTSRPLRILMIEPAHRKKMESVLSRLNAIG